MYSNWDKQSRDCFYTVYDKHWRDDRQHTLVQRKRRNVYFNGLKFKPFSSWFDFIFVETQRCDSLVNVTWHARYDAVLAERRFIGRLKVTENTASAGLSARGLTYSSGYKLKGNVIKTGAAKSGAFKVGKSSHDLFDEIKSFTVENEFASRQNKWS